MHKLLIKAQEFAVDKYGKALDDDKQPAIFHPFQTFSLIRELKPLDINLQCAALLHDMIEDTDTTYEELVTEFNQDIADLVNEVTHEGAKDSKGYYFPRLKTQRGILLKFCDRASNLSRMNAWSQKRQQSYLNRSKFWKSA